MTGVQTCALPISQVLKSMVVDLPWQTAYDPMRAVNGELDNAFTGGIVLN